MFGVLPKRNAHDSIFLTLPPLFDVTVGSAGRDDRHAALTYDDIDTRCDVVQF